VVARRNARGGRGAAEHFIAALRCLYRHAEADGHIPTGENPARKVAKPRRLPSTRRAVPDTRLAEINHLAATTGNDPALDALLLRLHTETACRRGGVLALRPADLDPDQSLIRLHEKGETVRWQSVSPTLMAYLQQHAEQRGAPANGQLLRYADGRPITSRRYDYLWVRIGRHLPWVATQQISTHWLRHTTLTWVERNFGYDVVVGQGVADHEDPFVGLPDREVSGGVSGCSDDLPVGVAEAQDLLVTECFIDGVGGDRLVEVLSLAAARVATTECGSVWGAGRDSRSGGLQPGVAAARRSGRRRRPVRARRRRTLPGSTATGRLRRSPQVGPSARWALGRGPPVALQRWHRRPVRSCGCR
jgi:site-specific recombinase XerD